ncbi:MAG: DUF5615 family PIN-like protein [Chloroflexi bacterium]|nr:DUF5615 family PIN-like protein [Chloroflexota bacterium]
MAAGKLRFYLDEHLPVAIAEQLQRRGIDTITVRDLLAFGESDRQQLARAIEMDRVMCSNDPDFIELASQGIEHRGIVIGQQDVHHIGDWVEFLGLMHAVYRSTELINRLEFLQRL